MTPACRMVGLRDESSTAPAELVAASFGWAGPKSWKAAIGLCMFLGLSGWAMSYPVALFSPLRGVDTSFAEDYVNGFNARNAATELALPLMWTFGWFGWARGARSVVERHRKQQDS